MRIKSIRGVKDILPDEIAKWQWTEDWARKIFRRYGFKEIRIPIFEDSRLFSRGLGETTDVVEKEMYTFADRSGDSLTLRPEGTASVVRSYVEHKMHHPPSVVKLYYMGPMFRYERPQAGRFRQFYQIGVEAMGSASPTVDAEVMCMLVDFFKTLGLPDVELQINSLGDKESRPQYRKILQNAIEPHLNNLCANCNQRYEKNPLRVLDCKEAQCKEIARDLPKTVEHLNPESREHFEEVQTLLKAAGISFAINPLMVRGLDYYSRTTFEITSSELGAQNALCGGGRYDYLVETFDGPPTPCFGFALGMERLVSVIKPGLDLETADRPDLYIVSLGDKARQASFNIAGELRSKGLIVERDYDGSSLKSQMRKANQKNCRFALIIGDNELESGKLVLKNMVESEQTEIPLDSFSDEILKIAVPAS